MRMQMAHACVSACVSVSNHVLALPQSEEAKQIAVQRLEQAAEELQAQVRHLRVWVARSEASLSCSQSALLPWLSQGRYFETIDCLEQGLVLRQLLHGAESEEVWRACSRLGELCNQVAMMCLHHEDLGMVLELLRKAELLTEQDPIGKAVTLNNLGVYFRRLNKLHTALRYMRQAVDIEEKLPNVPRAGDTHINLCVTLSQCGKHKAALKAGQRALQLLQQELFSKVHPGQAASHMHRADRIATMAVAHHNVAVEFEFLNKMTQALAAYAKGVELASTYLGEGHGVTIMLRKSQQAAGKVVSGQKAKRERVAATAQREAELEMLRIAKSAAQRGRGGGGAAEAPAPVTVAGASASQNVSALEQLVESHSQTVRDTKYGRGERPKPATVVKLEETLARLMSQGVVRSGASKNSSAALLSHTDGGRPSAGPLPQPGPARATGGMLFARPGSEEGKGEEGTTDAAGDVGAT